MGEIFANDVTNNGLISKIYKYLIQLSIEKQTPQLKNGQKTGIDIFPKRNADGQQAHEKMLNIANHEGNANQTHNEISPHTCQNGYHEKTTNNKYWQGCGETGTLVDCGNVNW